MITDRQIELIVGALLHDIGKVVYRSGDMNISGDLKIISGRKSFLVRFLIV